MKEIELKWHRVSFCRGPPAADFPNQPVPAEGDKTGTWGPPGQGPQDKKLQKQLGIFQDKIRSLTQPRQRWKAHDVYTQEVRTLLGAATSNYKSKYKDLKVYFIKINDKCPERHGDV